MKPIRRSKLYRDVEHRLDFWGIWVGGPESGGVRVNISRKPSDDFRKMKQHCPAKSSLYPVLWVKGIDKARRVLSTFLAAGKEKGFYLGYDQYGLAPSFAIHILKETAAMLGIPLLNDDSKDQAINAGMDAELERMVASSGRGRRR